MRARKRWGIRFKSSSNSSFDPAYAFGYGGQGKEGALGLNLPLTPPLSKGGALGLSVSRMAFYNSTLNKGGLERRGV